MDVSNIVNNNNQMFEILNKAQKDNVEIQNDITKINIKNKLNKDKENILGQIIDMFV